MEKTEHIIIKGARQHNLKNIDLMIPRNKLVVISGVSGSGKSTLAFDTLYAEGQRRYVESLSSYARQFLGLMEKPDVDYIDGLSPAIAIEQKTTNKNPRSTVGTITEIYDYLRLLFARIGKPYCYKCGKEINAQTVDEIVDTILGFGDGAKIILMAPVARNKKGEFQKVFEDAKNSGFTKVKVDGEIKSLEEKIELNKQIKHNIDIIIDRLIIKENIRARLTDSVETALKLTNGLVSIEKDGNYFIFSENYACVDCGISYPEIQPRLFSFNNPIGACSECSGLGTIAIFDIDKIIPDKNLSINEGAILTHLPKHSYNYAILQALSKHFKFSLDTPFKDLDEKIKNILLYGTDEDIYFSYRAKNNNGGWDFNKKFPGIINDLNRRYKMQSKDGIKEWLETFMSERTCPKCNGKRLNEIALSVKIENYNIYELSLMSIKELFDFFVDLKLSDTEYKIANQILKEIKARLRFLIDVGLDYLSLERKAGTLSGGESQRIRLATQIGSGLVGVLYVLDEPTIGLHQRDNDKLIETLKELRNLGNTLVVVEHDEQVILESDYIIELGPKAGEHGGDVVCQGSPEEIKNNPNSLTGKYLSRKINIKIPDKRREGNGKYLTIKNATLHNINGLNLNIPLGKLVVVTGVSGSGKSTLISDILEPILFYHLNGGSKPEKFYAEVEGLENLDKVINIDQSPIGRTPRSNPATYVGVFNYIRELFAQVEESKIRGYKAGRFSFNVKGGRCENCMGDGKIKIEMHFLPDIYITCDQCNGKRYNRQTLEIKYKGYNIADILDMTVENAIEVFKNHPSILRKLEILEKVGLGYIRLGQSATTLSGGEAQRIKLATELSKKQTGRTIYILDEPTTGLHFDDVKQLVNVINELVDYGNSMIIIEHNLDIIKIADHIIDLGPEGGNRGGKVVFQGTPEEIINCKESYTGQYLKKYIFDF